jgi:hypothetical protein
VTAGELQALGAETIQELQLVQGLEDQARLRGIVADAEGEALVARIHERKRLTTALEAADAAYTQAVEAAVGRWGDWQSVQVAGERVRECRAALKAAA